VARPSARNETPERANLCARPRRIASQRIGYDYRVTERQKLGWKAISYGAGGFAGLCTQRVLEAAWKGSRHASPPVPADRGSSWIEALSWAVATGVGIGVSRLVAIRTAAVVWEAATHEPPPEAALDAAR
jgi:hypothetical protein